jgi:hypothetical protein
MNFVFLPVWLAALCVGVNFVRARLSGWHRLEQSYGATAEPKGEVFCSTSALIGRIRYDNCLTLFVSDEGLFIKPWPILPLFHPPLLIPWHAIAPLLERKHLRTKSFSTTLSIGDEHSVKLVLYSVAASEEIQAQMNSRVAEVEDSPWSS